MLRIKLVIWLSESSWKKWLSKDYFQIIVSDYCQGFILLSALCVSVAKLLLTGGPDTLLEPGVTITALFICQRFADHPSRWLNKRCCWCSQVALEGGREATKEGVSNLQSGGAQHVSLVWWLGKSARSWINEVRLFWAFWTAEKKLDRKPYCLWKKQRGHLNEFTYKY